MKRKTLALDERLLDEALRLSGEQTCSRVIERALREMVTRGRARSIEQFAGSGIWTGSLSEMRRDAPSAGREGARVRPLKRRRVAR